ncbi:hypothetical protein [Methylomicrobium sp. Wu6]|uniref:hypothetical protein n=1 Tax=Methylomicrobium sp. Wu6 TaxID=3107928 RepID=UPI002DD63395|nr:hypothetical protein [Methylomicrobium sp. Wu6]MEC4747713.1 hypothetical protein [Methylomicrobium sp. Wu6]
MKSEINKVTYECELTKNGKTCNYIVVVKPIIPPTANGWAFEAKMDQSNSMVHHGKTPEEAFKGLIKAIETQPKGIF